MAQGKTEEVEIHAQGDREMTAPKGKLPWYGAILAAIERVKEPDGTFTYGTIKPETKQIVSDASSANQDPWEHIRNWVNWMARTGIIERPKRGHFRIGPTVYLEYRIDQLTRQVQKLRKRVKRLEEGEAQP